MSIRSSRLTLLALSASLLAACSQSPAPVPLTVSIVASPASLSSSGTVSITATAGGDQGVSKVELYDNMVKVGEDTTAPYTFSRSYGPRDSADHVLTARAYDRYTTTAEASSTVKVAIKALSVSTDPQILVYPNTVRVTALANAEAGHSISKVDFFEGTTLLGTATAAPYTTTVTYQAFQNGPHTIRARSTDDSGAVVETTTNLTVAVDASEPNGSVASAKSIAIGARIDGSIAGLPRDEDYFSFAAKAGDQLRLTVKSKSVFGDSTLDPYVEVLLPDGHTLLEKDDDSGQGLESDLRFNVVTAGTYYIRLTSFKIHDDPQATDDLPTNTYRMELNRR